MHVGSIEHYQMIHFTRSGEIRLVHYCIVDSVILRGDVIQHWFGLKENDEIGDDGGEELQCVAMSTSRNR